jgi:diketogulonate reductase-like aldo/keto reductase
MPSLNTENHIEKLNIEPAFFNSAEMELIPEMVANSASHWDSLEELVKQGSVRKASVMEFATDFLDRILPLNDASHTDVIRYTVNIPTRYARCFAELADGRTVCFRKLRKFIGWSGNESKRSLLFLDNGLHIEIQTDHDQPAGRKTPGRVRDVVLESASAIRNRSDRKFIGIDGSRILLPA